MTPSAVEFAHAKINLYLHVVGRRPDGYHLLDSLAVFAGAADRLSAYPADGAPGQVELIIEGPFGSGLRSDNTDNLIVRAAREVREAAGAQSRNFQALRIVLEKNLPVASGIGGGSADAAAAIRLLDRLWRPDSIDWMMIATALGADVPVCLAQVPRRMEGVGEILSDGPLLPQCGMVLVNCGQAVSTPQVFRERSPTFSPRATLPQGWSSLALMAEDLGALGNDLEDAAQRVCPAISDVLSALAGLAGARLVRMSGSGATCFALFDTADDAERACLHLRGSDWWVWAGELARYEM